MPLKFQYKVIPEKEVHKNNSVRNRKDIYDGQEIEFDSTMIGEEKEVTFENEKAAQAFIEGIRISLPPTFQYRIILKEDVQK